MNGKADIDHTHTAEDVGARPNTWMPTVADIGAYTKEQVMTAATAAKYGLPESATPDDVLAYLGQYNQHWWWRKATTSITAWREVQTLESKRHIASPDGTDKTITYSTKIQIDQSTGAVTLVNPQTFTVNYRGHQPPLPCYFTGLYDDPNSVFYFGRADNALFISSGDVGTMVWINPNSCYKITSESYQIPVGEVDYVHSSDRNAYPDSGVSGGYEYSYLGVPFENAVNPAKMASGSLNGTNTYGASKPSSVTFDFAPKFVFFVYRRSSGSLLLFGGYTGNNGASMAVPMDAVTTGYKSIGAPGLFGFSADATQTKKSSDGKTLYWYNTTNAVGQLNESGSTLYYLAIG